MPPVCHSPSPDRTARVGVASLLSRALLGARKDQGSTAHDAAARAQRLCRPLDGREGAAEALAAIGPLLCLFRASDPHPLSGWTQARWAMHCVSIDSDGPRETIAFFDALGQACWQLCLLPDSDYLSWDRMAESLPTHTLELLEPVVGGGRRCQAAQVVGQPLWRACPLRLHQVSDSQAGGRLAAACPALSDPGRREAQRLARRALPVDMPAAMAYG
ncbi:MAG: Hemin transport protein [Lysobacteraceae bacterium]